MDETLVNYLKSGSAWVLVGSGPSTEMGYPSWKLLAQHAIDLVKKENPASSLDKLEKSLENQRYTDIFGEVRDTVGSEKLLQHLQAKLKPTKNGKIYDLIARWPVPVYLTTNYDDEIQNGLAKIGQTYIPYTNSEDHLGHLDPGLKGAIFKLHGDLRSENGLILTSSHYKEILQADSLNYWRTKITSIFQMMSVIIIGHSLTDPHIQHVLELAKRGAGITRPICWIAPDVPIDNRRMYLEKYKIHVIPYDNSDGEHRNLLKVIENISDFVPPRETIELSAQIANVIESPLNQRTVASAFFVFNKLAEHEDLDEKRYEIILTAIQAILPEIADLGEVGFDQILDMIGWPSELRKQSQIIKDVQSKVVERDLLEKVNEKYKVTKWGEQQASENCKQFEHVKERFLNSVVLRIKRNYAMCSDEDAMNISIDIDNSLIGFFREGGLSLATTLLGDEKILKLNAVPSSILRFITEASTKYKDYLKRQIFVTIATDIFAHSEQVEREYLGQIAQGYFAFHALGMFGEFATEKYRLVKDTVWLIDSNVQIAALAIGTSTNMIIRESLNRLKELGIRFFTTENIFKETWDHLWFASKVIEKNGVSSSSLLAAATGQPPFRKSNLFLEGFINWQALGNPPDWPNFLYHIFESREPNNFDVQGALRELGIEVVGFTEWPGFSTNDYTNSEGFIEEIVNKIQNPLQNGDFDQMSDPYKKAKPESEVMVIIDRERNGNYYILSEKGEKSLAYFISDTSLLNAIYGHKLTWQPEAFLRFTSTLYPLANHNNSEKAFQIILIGLAQSGLRMLNDKTIGSVFGTAIDETKLSLSAQLTQYKEYVEEKYGESPEKVLERIPYQNISWAEVQFANDVIELEAQKREQAEKATADANLRARIAEEEAIKLQRFKKKMQDKEAERLRKKRQRKSKKK